MSVRGQITGLTFGNGVSESSLFEDSTGMPLAINAEDRPGRTQTNRPHQGAHSVPAASSASTLASRSASIAPMSSTM